MSDAHGSTLTQEPHIELDSLFVQIEDRITNFVKNELKRHQKTLSSESQWLEGQSKDEDMMNGGSREAFLKILLHFLKTMKQEKLANRLESSTLAAAYQRELKSNLKKKFCCLFEGAAKTGDPALPNKIYTELYITQGGVEEVIEEHEVRQIETASRKRIQTETTLRCEDFFKHLPGSDKSVRTVMMKGVAGIGKTVLTQKYTLDWAEGKTNKEIHFTFPFTFRELNLLKDKKYSLVRLIHDHFIKIKEAGICKFEEFNVLFIFDGLDECRLPLDFQHNEILTDPTESTTVDVLLTNLIKGKLLPSAQIWITTRPAAASQVPSDLINMVTEVRGFTDRQKEEYFKKRFPDEKQAEVIVSHINTSRSLHVMCHIPVFCCIIATVLEEELRNKVEPELPKTLTEIYIHFLVVQAKQKNIKYHVGEATEPHWNPENKNLILSLGKLAFEQLKKGNLIFYDSDLVECDIDVKAASLYSGVFTQIFKNQIGLYQDRVFCFIHLSVQEFLAALYVHLTFINSGVNLLSEEQVLLKKSPITNAESAVAHFYQSAVDKALQSPNGHLDLFLRLLVGLSLEKNQNLLRGLQTQIDSSSETQQETIRYIKRKIEEIPSAEKSIILFHCLNELNDRTLVAEIQGFLNSGNISSRNLSPAQWSALVFILLTSDKELDMFDLSKYFASEDALLKLLPVVKASKKAQLSGCNLSERSCEALSSIFESQPSSLRELDLSNNDLQDSGVKLLTAGLRSPYCALETLRLSLCNISSRSCETLSSVLSSESCRLRELDLSNNNLEDSGIEPLSEGLKNCALETLWLSGCLITEKGFKSLASALSSNPSHLRELDLSYNHPGETGEMVLRAGLEDPKWRLGTLRLEPCGEEWLKRGLRKYFCKLTLDPNTANRNLILSDNNTKVTWTMKDQTYPEHAERFDYCCQVLCEDRLTGRHYWEVEWEGEDLISVSYKGITRKGGVADSRFGGNELSWSLCCSAGGYSVWHNNRDIILHNSSSSDSNKVAVYVDHTAGTLSFYRVSSDLLTHLYTFHCKFTEPLYPGFGFLFGFRVCSGFSVSLCSV